ncbi:hypothetical protein GCM10028808_56180 [Spirosoma migulaei]
MHSQPKVDLLKEYIKTHIATQIVFPGVVPRRWGQNYTSMEIACLYQHLAYVVETANLATNQRLVEEFARLDPNHIHWFLGEFWRELVPLIDACQVGVPFSARNWYGYSQ